MQLVVQKISNMAEQLEFKQLAVSRFLETRVTLFPQFSNILFLTHFAEVFPCAPKKSSVTCSLEYGHSNSEEDSNRVRLPGGGRKRASKDP